MSMSCTSIEPTKFIKLQFVEPWWLLEKSLCLRVVKDLFSLWTLLIKAIFYRKRAKIFGGVCLL